eukprot:scaffold23172_cov19-Tisochrysis_lutea.AAC.1
MSTALALKHCAHSASHTCAHAGRQQDLVCGSLEGGLCPCGWLAGSMLRPHAPLRVASLSVQQQEGLAAAEQVQDLKAELANARHSLDQMQSALRDGQLHQTQM